jgi:hypothetical protein
MDEFPLPAPFMPDSIRHVFDGNIGPCLEQRMHKLSDGFLSRKAIGILSSGTPESDPAVYTTQDNGIVCEVK